MINKSVSNFGLYSRVCAHTECGDLIRIDTRESFTSGLRMLSQVKCCQVLSVMATFETYQATRKLPDRTKFQSAQHTTTAIACCTDTRILNLLAIHSFLTWLVMDHDYRT